MALSATNLIEPNGEILMDMFPSKDLPALQVDVSAWLTGAYAKVSAVDGFTGDADEAARHWVYYRAYTAVANRLAASFAGEQFFDDREYKRDMKAQVGHYRDLAASAADAYVNITGDVLPSTKTRVAKMWFC